jgi:small subunit ribosomal protein S4
MRDTSAKCRKCRREGEKLFLKGERCQTQKCAIIRRYTKPGQKPNQRPGKLSEFGKQLREKQKAKRIFGVSEKSFRNYFKKASARKGAAGQNFLQLLETRLDNAIFRAGFADSRAQARQIVAHGAFEVNGKKVNIPSFSLRPGDKISVREKNLAHPVIRKISDRKFAAPGWLKMDAKKLTVEITRFPESDELESSIVVSLIIEFYSR